ncbi:hypothetical protein Drorol1_Dr00007805 [Drosera rotundifolia]
MLNFWCKWKCLSHSIVSLSTSLDCKSCLLFGNLHVLDLSIYGFLPHAPFNPFPLFAFSFCPELRMKDSCVPAICLGDHPLQNFLRSRCYMAPKNLITKK